ncbi:MAG: hypothetical protein AAGA56_23295, partial [Myxococcota bacterium]
RKEPVMKESSIVWVGLDAHKKSVNAAILQPEGLEELMVANEPKAVRRAPTVPTVVSSPPFWAG